MYSKSNRFAAALQFSGTFYLCLFWPFKLEQLRGLANIMDTISVLNVPPRMTFLLVIHMAWTNLYKNRDSCSDMSRYSIKKPFYKTAPFDSFVKFLDLWIFVNSWQFPIANRQVALTSLRLLGVLGALYAFLFGLDLMGVAFKVRKILGSFADLRCNGGGGVHGCPW